uniref:Uncharacterized protein n=1 Tax=Ficedula albicollis TaxID=59894 RepID=A0A803VZH1_FICAL
DLNDCSMHSRECLLPDRKCHPVSRLAKMSSSDTETRHPHYCRLKFHAAAKSPFVGKGCRMKCHEKIPLSLQLLPQHFLIGQPMLATIQDGKPNKHPLVSRQYWKKF